MIHSITLRGLLSYGWEPVTLALRPLNVVIGTNGSGKSNLLEAIDLLRAAPSDLRRPMKNKGGVETWLHSAPGGDDQAVLEVVLNGPRAPLRYRLVLEFRGDEVQVASELLETRDNHGGDAPFSFFLAGEERATAKIFSPDGATKDPRFGAYAWEQLPPQKGSVLASLRGAAAAAPDAAHVASVLERAHILQGWIFGPLAMPRRVQEADLPDAVPGDYGSNLALVLHRLRARGETWLPIRDKLRSLYPQIDDVETSTKKKGVTFHVRERGLGPLVPPSRLSDGTLRWLQLLCLLMDPEPPPLICIEEPELGLHPDLIGTVAQLLREASERTQVIVTTHSEALVSAVGDSPEDIVLCEREESGTTLRRYGPQRLAKWLEDYQTLGQAWMSGAMGGTRW